MHIEVTGLSSIGLDPYRGTELAGQATHMNLLGNQKLMLVGVGRWGHLGDTGRQRVNRQNIGLGLNGQG